MQKKEFSITINAPREKVWEALWEESNYRKWTSVFSEGSHAQSDWREGSKILFLDGAGSGMVSEIAKKKEPEFMSFRHLGEVKDGIEDLSKKSWAGALENYTLKQKGNQTQLTVNHDVTDDFADYFENTFPKALAKVKEIAEEKVTA